MGRLTSLVAAAALVPLAVAGCSRGDDPLTGTRWTLGGWTLSSLSPADFTITAAFADGKISGLSGVNSYSGPYETGSGRAFEAGPLASTEMAGPEPAMRAERAYLMLLAQARSYELGADRLTLFDENGSESLVFDVASG